MVFREDASLTQAGHAGANRAMIRRVLVSLLRRAPREGDTAEQDLESRLG
ncbi:hypothetical protein FRUB_04729 [Fimbriiglobus ruber]|uniref:Uncharacterized protein n=1 Tax=Fimbriiglobus ruber TaxID=1908690 RepID=A0A225DXJ9_9BACT|nr:hypothetical protein FRUB_04729 [Fimbriiglobus ruber]